MKLALLQRHPDVRLRPDATIRDAMLAIAALGGHIRNNGDPGGRCSEEGTRTFSSWNVVPRWLSDVINPEGRNPGGPGAARQRRYTPSFLKKSFPLSSTRMNAGKLTTSIFHTASMPSSGKSMHSTFLMFSSASNAAGPPIEPR